MFFKIGVLKNFANFIGKYQCWSMGPSIKDVHILGGVKGGGGGQTKVDKYGQWEGGGG